MLYEHCCVKHVFDVKCDPYYSCGGKKISKIVKFELLLNHSVLTMVRYLNLNCTDLEVFSRSKFSAVVRLGKFVKIQQTVLFRKEHPQRTPAFAVCRLLSGPSRHSAL